jgi:hypothetical protein
MVMKRSFGLMICDAIWYRRWQQRFEGTYRFNLHNPEDRNRRHKFFLGINDIAVLFKLTHPYTSNNAILKESIFKKC